MSDVMREAIDTLSKSVIEKKEKLVALILDECAPGWVLADVAKRCRWVRRHDSDIETLTLDGLPIFELYPLKTELVRTDDGYRFVATQKYRDLRSTANSSGLRK